MNTQLDHIDLVDAIHSNIDQAEGISHLLEAILSDNQHLPPKAAMAVTALIGFLQETRELTRQIQ